jgi:hypothetical protein
MKRPGPRGSGPGCKSPAGRRRSGERSAGRSAASRDGRRALIARSQDLQGLPCPERLDVTRGTLGSIAGRLPGLPPCRRPRRPMRRITYIRTPMPNGDHPHGSVPRKDGSTPEPQVQETAAVARRSPPAFPAPDRVPHALSGAARSQVRPENERSPPACVGRRSMDVDARAMSPVWTRSGSRPINHGCSVRDPRPGSSLPTLRQLRSPFAGPWPTPRVAPGVPRPDVLRTLRPTLQHGNGRVVPLRNGRRSVASAHHSQDLRTRLQKPCRNASRRADLVPSVELAEGPHRMAVPNQS